MTPLDDELRSVLDRRAASVLPAGDPLAGIESRARGMRRRRAALAAGGSALAVAAAVLAVPLFLTGTSTTQQPPASSGSSEPSATATPSASESPVRHPSNPYALDPSDPWAKRVMGGLSAADQRLAEQQMTNAVAARWGAALDVIPLWETRLDRGPAVSVVGLVDLASDRGWHVMTFLKEQSSRSGQIISDRQLGADETLLSGVLPGVETPYVYAIASPDVRRIEYTGAGEPFKSVSVEVRGVALVDRGSEGLDKERLRVIATDGSVITTQPVELGTSDGDDADLDATTAAESLVDAWQRGDRTAARKVATQEVVDQLFAESTSPRPYLTGCQAVSMSSKDCTFEPHSTEGASYVFNLVRLEEPAPTHWLVQKVTVVDS